MPAATACLVAAWVCSAMLAAVRDVVSVAFRARGGQLGLWIECKEPGQVSGVERSGTDRDVAGERVAEVGEHQ